MIQAHVLHGGSHLFFYKQHGAHRLPKEAVGIPGMRGDFVSKTLLGPGRGWQRGKLLKRQKREMILSHPQQSLNHPGSTGVSEAPAQAPGQEGPSEAQPRSDTTQAERSSVGISHFSVLGLGLHRSERPVDYVRA